MIKLAIFACVYLYLQYQKHTMRYNLREKWLQNVKKCNKSH